MVISVLTLWVYVLYISVTFGKAIHEAHQRTNLYNSETITQLKSNPVTSEIITIYQNMVGT